MSGHRIVILDWMPSLDFFDLGYFHLLRLGGVVEADTEVIEETVPTEYPSNRKLFAEPGHNVDYPICLNEYPDLMEINRFRSRLGDAANHVLNPTLVVNPEVSRYISLEKAPR